jgi:hypothetical protein
VISGLASASPVTYTIDPNHTHKGTLGGFVDGSPTTVAGMLTLHGITKPVVLQIKSFKCTVDLPAT